MNSDGVSISDVINNALERVALELESGEHELNEIEQSSRAALDAARARISDFEEHLRAAESARAEREAAIKREIVEFSAEIARASAAIDAAFDQLEGEVDEAITRLVAALEAVNHGVDEVDHAVSAASDVIEQAQPSSGDAARDLKEFLASRVPSKTREIEGSLSAKFSSTRHKADEEWTPALEHARQRTAHSLEQHSEALERSAHDAYTDARSDIDRVSTHTTQHAQDRLSNVEQHASRTGANLTRHLDDATTAANGLFETAESLNLVSQTTRVGLDQVLGVLRELQQLFARFN